MGDVELQPGNSLSGRFKFHSGRVIALGRVMLAVTYAVFIMVGSGQPELTWAQSYTFLVLYVLGAISIAVATWNDWWLDARLAVLTHEIDMAIFTGIAFSSSGTTSPFTLFFTLPLLSAAVRWSWPRRR